MTNDEIVRALRCRRAGKRKCARCPYKAEMSCTEAAMDDAADLIESLQAQLAESQRREQAAVEAIKRASDYCGIHFNPCEAECSLAPWCKWRGPQEAGKGEAG